MVHFQPVAESFLCCLSTDRLTRVCLSNARRACLNLVRFLFFFSSTPQASFFIMCQSHRLSVSLDIDTQPMGETGLICVFSTEFKVVELCTVFTAIRQVATE